MIIIRDNNFELFLGHKQNMSTNEDVFTTHTNEEVMATTTNERVITAAMVTNYT